MPPHAPQTPQTPRTVDPVTEAYRAGIDLTLLRHNLTLTPTQRVEQLAQLLELAEEARRSGRALR
jgi:hypothetical protein